MGPTIKRLNQIADEFEERAKKTRDLYRRAEIVDVVIRARFLISEIARLFETAKEMEDA